MVFFSFFAESRTAIFLFFAKKKRKKVVLAPAGQAGIPPLIKVHSEGKATSCLEAWGSWYLA